MPTLLAAAGTVPDPIFVLDGISMLPVLTQNACAISVHPLLALQGERTAGGERRRLQVPEGSRQYVPLQRRRHPMERANLKVREKDVYDRLVAKWRMWNTAMLPEIDESNTGDISGDEWADHIGAQKPSGKASNPDSAKTSPAKPD